MALKLAGSNFGYLHSVSLEEALADLSSHGFEQFELTPMPPHLDVAALGIFEIRELERRIEALGMRCISVNPGFVDINVISTSRAFRELSLRRVEEGIRLAGELGASSYVLIGGRLHPLAPASSDDARAVLVDSLERLLPVAESCGVEIALENSPYGFMGRSEELVSVLEEVDHAHLGVCFDAANAHAQEHFGDALRRVGSRLSVAHISDTWTERLAHTSVDRGEVDFSGFAAALREAGYERATVYELVDGEDPRPRVADDVKRLAELGWSV